MANSCFAALHFIVTVITTKIKRMERMIISFLSFIQVNYGWYLHKK